MNYIKRVGLYTLLAIGLCTAVHARYVKYFSSISAMVAANPNDVSTVCLVKELTDSTSDDGACFYYDATSVLATNTTTVFKPLSHNGRWIRTIYDEGVADVLLGTNTWTGTNTFEVQIVTTGFQADTNFVINISDTNYVYAIKIGDNTDLSTHQVGRYTGNGNGFFRISGNDYIEGNTSTQYTDFQMSSLGLGVSPYMGGITLKDVNVRIGKNDAEAPLYPFQVGTNATRSVNPQVVIAPTISDPSANWHGYSDSSRVSNGNGYAFNSYDARVLVTGTSDFDHYAGLQMAPVLASSGYMTNYYGIWSRAEVTNDMDMSGAYSGYFLQPSTIGGPSITTNIVGFFGPASVGASVNWSVYSAGPLFADSLTTSDGLYSPDGNLLLFSYDTNNAVGFRFGSTEDISGAFFGRNNSGNAYLTVRGNGAIENTSPTESSTVTMADTGLTIQSPVKITFSTPYVALSNMLLTEINPPSAPAAGSGTGYLFASTNGTLYYVNGTNTFDLSGTNTVMTAQDSNYVWTGTHTFDNRVLLKATNVFGWWDVAKSAIAHNLKVTNNQLWHVVSGVGQTRLSTNGITTLHTNEFSWLTNDGSAIDTRLRRVTNGIVGLSGLGGVYAISLPTSDAPATPASSSGYLYTKSDGKIYWKNASATEYDLTSSVGGAGTGNVVSPESSEQYSIPMYSDTTGVNIEPSGLIVSGGGLDLTVNNLTVDGTLEMTDLNVATLVVTNPVDGIAITNASWITITGGGSYGADWENSERVPTKGALYAKIESISTTGGGGGYNITGTQTSDDDTAFTLTSIVLDDESTFSVMVDVIAAGPTNAATYELRTAGRVVDGTATLWRDLFSTQINNDSTNYSLADLATNAWLEVDGDDLLVKGKGLASEELNWSASGFYRTRVNAAATYVPGGGGGSTNLTNGLIAYWRMDETSGTRYDALGTNNLLAGGSTDYDDGLITNAVKFADSAARYFYATNEAAFSLPQFTFGGWVYIDSLTKARAFVAKDSTVSGHREFSLLYSYTANAFRLTLYPDESTSYTATDTYVTPAVSNWFFLVASGDATNGTIKLRVGDTNSLSQWTTTSGLADWTGTMSTTNKLVFGRLGSANYPMSGLIDEFWFFNRVLTDDEVNAIYTNNVAGGSYPYE